MRIGIWGTGGIARAHTRHFARLDGAELVMYDLDPARAEAMAATVGGRAVATPEELLAAVDGVVIAVPTDAHFACARQALEAGKHVLLEKPITRNLEQADELIALAQAKGVHLVPAHVSRYFPEFVAARDRVNKGAVGTPAAIRVYRGGKAPQGTEGWFQNLARSGGVILDLAVHDFDWLLWTFGPVERIYCRSVRMGADAREVPGDYALATITFQNGAVAHLESCWMDPLGFNIAFEVAGSEGLIAFDARAVAGLRVTGAVQAAGTNRDAGDDPFYGQAKMFGAVLQGAAPTVTAQEGRAALALALAAEESANTGRVIVMDAATARA